MSLLSPLVASYGPLEKDANFARLVVDAITLTRLHAYPWDVPLDAGDIVRTARGRDLFSVYAAVYERYRRHVGKARWGCKSTFMIDHDEAILRYFPHARFLFLVRDARDVAVSARQSVFNHFHPYFVARLWSRQQRKGLGMLRDLPAEQILEVHYEDLTRSPETEVPRICAFLGEAFEEPMMAFHRSSEARKSASLCQDWRNTDQGFLANNSRKFLRELRPDEVALIEAVAERELTALGYGLVSSAADRERASRISDADRLSFDITECIERARVEWNSFLKDRNHLLRVRKIMFLAWLRLRSRLFGAGAGSRA